MNGFCQSSVLDINTQSWLFTVRNYPVATSTENVISVDDSVAISYNNYTKTLECISTVSSPDLQHETKYKIFPNPASNKIYLQQIDDNGQSTINLSLYNVSGEIVLEKVISNNNSTITLDLPMGVYWYKIIENENESYKGKLIIMN
jgi:hypothetical protein